MSANDDIRETAPFAAAKRCH